MTTPLEPSQLTLREWSYFRIPLLIWLVLSVLATLAGPFGTLEVMRPVPRAVYWTGTIGVSILLSLIAGRFAQRSGRLRGFAIWALFVLAVGTGSHLANMAIFSEWGGLHDWLYLTGITGVTTAAVHLLIWGATSRKDETAPQAKVDRFQRRLTLEARGPLVRIEAQDHYLNVVTQKGSDLILMRLGDAMSELEGRGLQVHRSHWIAVDAVTAHRREKGRNILVMADGAEVPVSRSFRAQAQSAGLF